MQSRRIVSKMAKYVSGRVIFVSTFMNSCETYKKYYFLNKRKQFTLVVRVQKCI